MMKQNIRPLWLLLLILALASPPGFCDTASRENNVVKAVRLVRPAVVNISSQYEIRKNSNPFSGYGMAPMLEKFFRDFYAPDFERRQKRTSLGSGVIIDGRRGLVLTNAHVIEKATRITVTLNNEKEFEAAIVGLDPESDLAVLKIQSEQALPAIQMGDSNNIMIGESVIAIGNPFGFSHTVTSGVISAVDRSIKTSQRVFHEFIQTDASINPGNSGGPLLNIDGELIGINTAIFAEAQGIGFAIPINRAKRIISDLIAYGEVVQAWIGLQVQPVDPNLAAYLGLDNDDGVIVAGVESGSPAETAKILEGDVVLSLDGKKIVDLNDYFTACKRVSAEQTVAIGVFRQGRNKQISVKTRIFPLERALDVARRQLGIVVAELDRQTRAKYRIQAHKGVIITQTQRGSHLDSIGVQPGDVIRQIDEEKVDSLADFEKALVKYRNKRSVVLLVQRGGSLYYIHTMMRGDK
jgi:Do/DeqQ family serine protease